MRGIRKGRRVCVGGIREGEGVCVWGGGGGGEEVVEFPSLLYNIKWL